MPFPSKESGNGTIVKKRKILSPEEYAVRLLARRSYSIESLRKKMLEKQYGNAVTGEVICRFIQCGYLNDHLFAESLALSLHSAGYGRKRIIGKLREKGIPREIIRETLEKMEEKENKKTLFSGMGSPVPENEAAPADGESTAAVKALKSKWRTWKKESDIRKKKEKALRFLAGRGFEAGVCYRALDQVMQEENTRDISGEDFI